LQELGVQGLKCGYYGLCKGYLQTELYLFLQYYKKRRLLHLHGREMAILGLKTLKNNPHQQRIPHILFCFIGKQRQPLLSSKGKWKITQLLFHPT